ncbi:MAG TPA: bifunctional methylenetetrahydrofolate dehydrogenase/methenyltetrahydrofolate cyclohydrolase FolD [Pseudomonadales bacterium]|nr:bifunctional methylenetetrahydrofolate dehydrogenase/methenyltetrahydrofolate cyclohydrolase FolD [Pseudomonadales bacterium]
MTAQLIDGNSISKKVLADVKAGVEQRLTKGLRAPGLAVVLVGDDPASAVYVGKKKKSCAECGIESFAYTLPASTTQDELLKLVDELNAKPEVDGILVQLPLPKHIDSNLVLDRILPEKDVDGFHPFNLGLLAQKRPLLRPCTPKGVMTLLAQTGIHLAGLDAVVIGASNIVGKPMTLELLMAGCTVTTCHSRTKNLPEIVKRADLVVAAVGKMHYVKADWIKSGAIVIDVGIHRMENNKLTGDVEPSVVGHAAWFTPVPGGVGPMTVASLMENTLEAANQRNG